MEREGARTEGTGHMGFMRMDPAGEREAEKNSHVVSLYVTASAMGNREGFVGGGLLQGRTKMA